MKKFSILLVLILMVCGLAACGGSSENNATAEGGVYTGILEEKKDFMIIVTSEDNSEAYIFQLEDGVKCEPSVGEKITVTYTGDISKFMDDELLMAENIELAE